jgi:hypothetical protein
MQPVITPTVTKSSTSTTTTSSTVSTQQNHPAKPIIQSKPASERSSSIRALLNEQKTGVPPLNQSIPDSDFEMVQNRAYVDIEPDDGLEEGYPKVTSEEAFMLMLTVDDRVENHAKYCVDILQTAITKNYALCVDYLLQKGAPVHDPSLDEWSYLQGFQPLAIAIKNENVEIARALLNAGAVPSEREISNARYSKNPEFVRLFDNYH